jgi:hypothetical protein
MAGCDPATGCFTTPVAAGTACGAAICFASNLTLSACDGLGNCTPGFPAPCPGNFGCASPTACATSCAGDAQCAPGFRCAGGACVSAQGDCPAGADFCVAPSTSCNGSGGGCECGTTFDGGTACTRFTKFSLGCGGCTSNFDCAPGFVCIRASGNFCKGCTPGLGFCEQICPQ